MKVSLVVVCHHSSGVLEGCVRSFRCEAEAAGATPEVVVVEQSEDQGEEQAAAALADRMVVRPNGGYAAGLNAGVAAAEGDVLLLANPDLEFLEGSVEALLEGVGRGWDVVGAQLVWDRDGSLLLPPPEDPSPAAELVRTWRHRGQMAWRLGLGRYLERSWRLWSGVGAVPWPALRGGLLAVPRPALPRLGPLDEGYFLYYEETEWLLRARRRGLSLAVAAGARVVHRWGHATARRDDAAAIEERSRQRFFARNYPPLWRRLLARWDAGPGRAAVPAAPLDGQDQIPATPADLWLLSRWPDLQPAAGAIGGSRLPSAVSELATHGRWYALAAARRGSRWRTLGAWTWELP